MIEVRSITITEAIPVRHTVLREGRPIEECFYPRDDDPKTRHFGAFKDGVLLSIASLYEERSPSDPAPAAVRLRGMATVRHAQGTGVGTALLRYCVNYAKENGAGLFWCNGRTSALQFYENFGFEPFGDVFDLPKIGPHKVMVLRL